MSVEEILRRIKTRETKRELARAYRLVANSMDNNDSAEKLIAEILNEKADAIERELEADSEKKV